MNLPASRLAALLLAPGKRLGAAGAQPGRPGGDAAKQPLAQRRLAGVGDGRRARAAAGRAARVYGTIPVADAWMGDGRAAATADDIGRALALYRRACALGHRDHDGRLRPAPESVAIASQHPR